VSNAPDQAALKRGNVLWLLAAMAFVIAPHAERLPIWVSVTCIGVGIWRGLIAWHGWKMPHWLFVAGLAIATAAGTWLSYSRLYGRDASSTLLILMLCLKLLEMRSRRDALLTVFLGFFLVFTNFLYSQTIFMGVYMMLCIWIFMATLVGFNRVGTQASFRERALPAGKIILQAIPLMLVVFILFPRVSTPLWRLPQEGTTGRTGLSESVSPGDLNKLIQSEQVAFRADFRGSIPKNDRLYWRGPVMADFDGRTWTMSQFPGIYSLKNSGIEAQGDLVDYVVTMEPHGKTWMFALDMPDMLPPDGFLQGDYQIRSSTPVNTLRRYEMRSALKYRAQRPLTPDARRRYTALPRNTNPRATRYAQELREKNSSDRKLIDATLLLFNQQFIYTLEPPMLGRSPVDEFLFDTKRGFCEHYASAFVYLMRSAGIPARVVLGYQGGEVNTVGNYLIVRQTDAHAWAEVWLEGEGWVRTDPTAAVSPDRIERGMDLAMGPVGTFPNLIAADKLGLLRQLRYTWDAFNNQWNQWVVGYNTDRQAYFLQNLGIDSTDWKRLALWLLFGGLAASGFVSAFILLKRRRIRRDPALQAYDRFQVRMRKAGFVREQHEGPLDFLARIERDKPELAHASRRITELYVALRYGTPGSARATDPQLTELKTAIANIRTS
jgi:protein-glutamine gamma-glutamyltransferase